MERTLNNVKLAVGQTLLHIRDLAIKCVCLNLTRIRFIKTNNIRCIKASKLYKIIKYTTIKANIFSKF